MNNELKAICEKYHSLYKGLGDENEIKALQGEIAMRLNGAYSGQNVLILHEENCLLMKEDTLSLKRMMMETLAPKSDIIESPFSMSLAGVASRILDIVSDEEIKEIEKNSKGLNAYQFHTLGLNSDEHVWRKDVVVHNNLFSAFLQIEDPKRLQYLEREMPMEKGASMSFFYK
ncbi:hypothetical protein ACFL6I_23835 [candidate division KSB1 bacterium]